MNMIATVATKEKAWQLADKLFPTDYSRNEPDSLRAGYPIFNTTSTDSKYKGFFGCKAYMYMDDIPTQKIVKISRYSTEQEDDKE